MCACFITDFKPVNIIKKLTGINPTELAEKFLSTLDSFPEYSSENVLVFITPSLHMHVVIIT